MPKNQNGFSGFEIIALILIISLVGSVGWYVWRSQSNAKRSLDAAGATSLVASRSRKPSTPNNFSPKAYTGSYTGWKTYSSPSLGLSVKYPQTWLVDDNVPQTCDGEFFVSFVPSDSEVGAAAHATDTSLGWYNIVITRFGTESPNCGPDGNDFTNSPSSEIQSVDQFGMGAFNNDWLTFFNGSGQSGNKIDTGMITNTKFSGGAATFPDAETQIYNGKTYQIQINTSAFKPVQNSNPVLMDINLFQKTALFSDTVGLLESAAAHASDQ